MSDALITTLGWICWIAALSAIAGYVLAFLRNRPHLRPFNSLGLLFTGSALLAIPTLIGEMEDIAPGTAVYVVLALGGAVVFQLVAALRRRGRRVGEART